MIKENYKLDGVKETMLIPLYARAWASKRKNPDYIDEVAINIIDNLDYDFKKWKANKLNIWGCSGRTVILDEQTKEFIKNNPNCTIINLASGLDDRFSRVDNGQITWYNIDFPEVIDLRNDIIQENNRCFNLAYDMLDFNWIKQIKDKSNVLIIIEGVLMYIKKNDVKTLLDKISEEFSNVTILLELMTKWMVDHQKLHDVTKKTNNSFVFGIETSKDIVAISPSYEYVDEYNITDYMVRYNKFGMFFIKGFLRNKNNRIVKIKN